MRHLLHFGLFALALTAVTQADAQGRRGGDRHTTVVIAPGGGPRVVQPVRPSFDPPRAVYDSRRTFHESPRATHDARRVYFNQRQDLEQIVSIARRWELATAHRDRRAQLIADRRLDAWLEREIRESIREPSNQRYAHRVRMLSNELAMLEQRIRHGRGHGGYYKAKHGRGAYYVEKARILADLVRLSERQLQRAHFNIGHPVRPSFAHR